MSQNIPALNLEDFDNHDIKKKIKFVKQIG